MDIRLTTNFAAMIRVTVAALLVSSVLFGRAIPATAQEAPGLVGDNEYESPQFDFALAWDDPWQLSDDPESEDGSYDRIKIDNEIAFVDIFLLFPTDDPQEYVDALIQNIEEQDPEFDVVGTEQGNGHVSATIDFIFTSSNGTETALREYIESSELESHDGGEALFSTTMVAAASSFNDQWESLNESVERDGRDPLFRGTPSGLDDGGDIPSRGPTDEPPVTSGIDGDTFLGPNYGLTVEWDDRAWDAEDESTDEDDHLVLTADDTRIDVQTITIPDGRARDCVTDNADLLEEEGFDDVRRASGADAPELPDDAFGRVYSYTDSSGALDTDFLHYFECRPIEGDTFLQLGFKAPADDYEDQLPDFEDIVATIEIAGPPENGGSSTGRGDTREPVLADDSFTGGVFPFTVEWDPDIWEAEEQEFSETYEAVRLSKDGNTLWIEALGGNSGDPDDCLDAALASIEDARGFSDFRVNTRLDPPRSARGVSAAIVTNTVTLDSGNEIEALQYVECRALIEGEAVLQVTSYMTQDGYEDEVPFLEDVLRAIEIVDVDSNGSGSPDPTREPDDNGSTSGSGELPGVDGNEYTGPRFPVSLSWDDDVWEVTRATSSRNGDLLQLTNGTTVFTVTAGEFDTDPADCIEQFAADSEASDGVDDYGVAINDEGEEIAGTTANGAWSYFSYDLDGEAYFDYIECAEAPDYVVVVVVQIPAIKLASELAAIQALLATISAE